MAAADAIKDNIHPIPGQTMNFRHKFDMTTMEGREMLRFVPTFPFLSQFLPFFDQYALSHNIWSPQSDALVLPMLGEDFNQIVVVSIASGEERVIAEGTMPFWSLR